MDRDPPDREDAELAAALRALREASPQELEAHPSSDELLAYHARTLPLAETERIRDHLALCSACAQRGLDLVALSQPERLAGEDPEPERAEAEWDELRPELEREGLLRAAPGAVAGAPAVPAMTPTPPAARRPFFGSPSLAYAVAALFFLTTVGLGGWILVDADRATPRANLRLLDVFPNADAQRAGGAPVPSIMAGDGDLVLILNVGPVAGAPGGPGAAGYRAEIVALGPPPRSPLWAHDGLEPIENHFTIAIPGRMLEPGRYRVRLYAPAGGILAECDFTIMEP